MRHQSLAHTLNTAYWGINSASYWGNGIFTLELVSLLLVLQLQVDTPTRSCLEGALAKIEAVGMLTWGLKHTRNDPACLRRF